VLIGRKNYYKRRFSKDKNISFNITTTGVRTEYHPSDN